jgi:hypothetical protein
MVGFRAIDRESFRFFSKWLYALELPDQKSNGLFKIGADHSIFGLVFKLLEMFDDDSNAQNLLDTFSGNRMSGFWIPTVVN